MKKHAKELNLTFYQASEKPYSGAHGVINRLIEDSLRELKYTLHIYNYSGKAKSLSIYSKSGIPLLGPEKISEFKNAKAVTTICDALGAIVYLPRKKTKD